MVSKLTNFAFCLLIIGLAGCAMQPPAKSALTSLQIQTMQTQRFDAELRSTFNAVMNTLQNNGYTIQSANFKTGFITAKSPTRDQAFIDSNGIYNNEPVTTETLTSGEQTATQIGLAIGITAMAVALGGGGGGVYVGGGGSQSQAHYLYSVTVTAYVTPVEKAKNPLTQVRLSFVQNETITGNGTVTKDTQILDPNFYTQVFSQIRQQIFVAGAITN
jgi:hypothetical protein